MSVRQQTRRDPKTGEARKFWIVDVDFEHADGRRERVRKVAPVQTKRGAEEYERQVRASLLDPKPQAKEDAPRFKEFVEKRWLPTYPDAAGNRPSTIAEKQAHFRLYLDPELGRHRLDEIKGEVVDRFFATLRKKGLSPKTCRNVRATLHRILVSAVDWSVIEAIPKLPKIKVPEAPFDFFSKEESEKLLAAARHPEELAILTFALHTGARAGEQIAIEWGDIDFVSRKIIFRRSRSTTFGWKARASNAAARKSRPSSPGGAEAISRAIPPASALVRLRQCLAFSGARRAAPSGVSSSQSCSVFVIVPAATSRSAAARTTSVDARQHATSTNEKCVPCSSSIAAMIWSSSPTPSTSKPPTTPGWPPSNAQSRPALAPRRVGANDSSRPPGWSSHGLGLCQDCLCASSIPCATSSSITAFTCTWGRAAPSSPASLREISLRERAERPYAPRSKNPSTRAASPFGGAEPSGNVGGRASNMTDANLARREGSRLLMSWSRPAVAALPVLRHRTDRVAGGGSADRLRECSGAA